MSKLFFILSILLTPLIGFSSGGDTEIALITNNIQGELIENCDSTTSFIIITRDSIAPSSLMYRIERTGTAVNGTDYITNLTDTIIFTSGQQIAAFSILPVQDTIIELPEFIRFNLFLIGETDTLCDSLDITVRDHLQTEIIISEASSFCTPPDVRLYATGALNYMWQPESFFSDPTADTISINNVISDTIILTGSGKGCSFNDTRSLEFFNSGFNYTISPNDSICLGDQVSLTIHPQGILDTIIISPDSTIISRMDTIFNFRPEQSGFIYLETVSGECRSYDSIFVLVDRINAPTLIPDTTICRGSSVQLSAPFNNDLNSTFSWTPASGLSSAFISNPTSITLETTTYTLVTTGVNQVCKIEDEVKVNVIDNRINYELIDQNTACLGEQIRAMINTSNDPNTVTITPNQSVFLNGDTIRFFPSISTDYNINIDHGFCNENIQESITIIDPQVDIVIERPTTICIGDSIEVKLVFNDSPTSISWTPDNSVRAVNDSIYIFKPTESDIYSLLVDYEFCTYEESIDLTVVDNLFEINLPGDTTICLGESIEGLISFNDQPNIIQIDPEENTVINGNQITFSPNETTSYEIFADFGACLITKTVRIQVDNLPDLTVTASPELNKYCEGQSVELLNIDFNTDLFPDISFNWSPNDINVNGSTDEAHLDLTAYSPQTYIRETVNGKCNDTFSFDLNITPKDLDLSFTDTSICVGNTVQLNIADTDINNIEWTPPRNISCENCSDPNFSPTETTVYTLDYEREGCVFSQDIQVRVSALDTTYFTPIFGCIDSILQIDITNPIFDNSVWDNDFDLSCTMCNNPEIRVSESKTYTIRDFDAMCEHVGILQITAYPEISAQVNLIDPEEDIFIGQEIHVEAQVISDHDATILWIVNNELNANTGSNLTLIADVFAYNIQLIATDNETGCSAVDDIRVTIMAIDEIRFPNVFTPNNDGRNDFFQPALAQVLTINSMKIFNRWGQLVYNSTSVDAKWNGRLENGNEAPSDTYVYQVNVTRPNGIQEQHHGDINLLR